MESLQNKNDPPNPAVAEKIKGQFAFVEIVLATIFEEFTVKDPTEEFPVTPKVELNVADVPDIAPIVVVPFVAIVIPVPPLDCNLKGPASFLIVAVFTPPSSVLVELFKNIFKLLTVLLPMLKIE